MPKPTLTPINATAPEPSEFDKDLKARIAKAQAAVTGETVEAAPAAETIVADAPPAEIPATAELTDESPAPEPPIEPVAEPAPAVEAAKPEAAPVETKPAEPKPPKEENFDWKAWRETQKENRRLKRELEAARKEQPKPAEKPAEAAPVNDEDPFGTQAALHEAQEARRETALTRQQLDQDRQDRELNAQATEFRQTKPDYDDALNHVRKVESVRYYKTASYVDADKLLGDPRMRTEIEKAADSLVAVDDKASPLGFRTVNRSEAPEGRELTDQEVARMIATEIWMRSRTNDVIQGAKASGRKVPEVVYELAGDMGYQPRAIVPAPNGGPAAPATPVRTAAESVRQQAKIAAASKTLSATSTQAPEAPPPAQFRTLAEFMAYRQRDPAGARSYMERMTATHGDKWHRNLA